MLLTIQIDTDKYILVPRVPTKEMKGAFWEKVGVWVEEGRDRIDELWAAMISKSPCLYPPNEQ